MRYIRITDRLEPLSCVALGTDYYGKTIPEADARALLDTYAELGGNVIDTAHVYSDYLPGEKHMSEKVIGRWLRDTGLRQRVVLCTKGGFPELGDMHASRINRDAIRADIYESLACLGTDTVEIYWLHRDAPQVPVAEICGWMAELKAEGAFKCWGVSNWTHTRIAEATEYCTGAGLEPPRCSQIKWSLAVPIPGSAGDDTLVEMNAAEHAWYMQSKMPVFAFSSQAKGFFSKLKRVSTQYEAPQGTRVLGGVADPGGKAGARYFSDVNIERFAELERMSAETGISVSRLAIAWMTRPGTFPVIPIIGARSVCQLCDSVAGAELLIDRELAARYPLFRRDIL